jgi:diketogulonate reductase-like aldo/keto reductase
MDETVVAMPKSSNIKHVEENASSVSARFSEEEYQTIDGG